MARGVRTTIRIGAALALLVLPAAAQPGLELLASTWQPVDAPTYGAPSVTNGWGSMLTSPLNVLGFNALEMAPFSSGWDSTLLYGWPNDTAALFLDGHAVPPSASLWTPFSVLRNGSAVTSAAQPLHVTSEVRMLFESQGVVGEVNVSVPDGYSGPATTFTLSLALPLPLRVYPRGDACPSWHYPTHAVPCCFNWFPPTPSSGSEAQFTPSWHACGAAPSSAPSTLLQRDALSPAVSAVAFAAEDVAADWEAAWGYAQADWQDRFNAAFDSEDGHFSGSLPLVSTTPVTGESGAGAFDYSFTDGFTSPLEHIYYHGVISFLANERTNLPVAFPANGSTTPCPTGAGWDGGSAAAHVHDARAVGHGSVSLSASSGWQRVEVGGEDLAPPRGVARHLRPRTVRLQGAGGSASGETAFVVPRVGRPLARAPVPRVYITGGGLNSSTNAFYWDYQYSAQTLAMLDPAYLASTLTTWLASLDPDTGLPSYWAFWGYDYASQRGIGNYYGANDMTLFRLLQSYVRASGDWEWLGESVRVAFPNGTTVGTTTPYNLALAMATHWRNLTSTPSLPPYIADYGTAPNLLECVPTYQHGVASLNAANAWMSAQAALLAQGWKQDNATAARLREEADAIASAVLSELYVPPSTSSGELGGVWRALYPNGTARTVRHVMDYVYVMEHMGPGGGGGGGGYLPPSTMAEMQEFVERELLVPHWMRALSLNDSAAPFSNRSDHGPSGAYIGWPALVTRAFGQGGAYAAALALMNDTDFVAWLGPYGQATEIRPPGTPYKPMAFTLYNEMVGLSWTDTVLQTFFGFSPPLAGPPGPGAAPPPPLTNPTVPRGFVGAAKGVRWQGQAWDILSSAEGLSVQRSAGV